MFPDRFTLGGPQGHHFGATAWLTTGHTRAFQAALSSGQQEAGVDVRLGSSKGEEGGSRRPAGQDCPEGPAAGQAVGGRSQAGPSPFVFHVRCSGHMCGRPGCPAHSVCVTTAQRVTGAGPGVPLASTSHPPCLALCLPPWAGSLAWASHAVGGAGWAPGPVGQGHFSAGAGWAWQVACDRLWHCCHCFFGHRLGWPSSTQCWPQKHPHPRGVGRQGLPPTGAARGGALGPGVAASLGRWPRPPRVRTLASWEGCWGTCGPVESSRG